MFNDKEQAQFEHLQYIQKRLVKRKKNSKINVTIVFLIAAVVAYLGTENLPLAGLIAYIAAAIRGASDDVIRENLLLEHSRALCCYEGDLDYLTNRLNIERNINQVSKEKN